MKIPALTRGQEDIASLVAAGLSNRQIAQKAGISESTVKNQLHRAYQKLGIANRATLAARSAWISGGKAGRGVTSGKLTAREAEIARLVAAGLSNRQIAQKAGISESTVKIHLHRAYKKLGIANRAALAVMVSSRRAGPRRARPI
jgi:DNA-binding NarL/FixJ family response regulator